MFSWLKRGKAARAEAEQQAQARQQAAQVARALVLQIRGAATLRQLQAVQELALPLLPAPLQAVVQEAVAQRLLRLPQPLPAPTTGSPKSTAYSTRTAKRSTSKRRRAR